jgi:hypothetical protein
MDEHTESLSKGFARVYGSPGEAPRVLGLLRAFWPLLLVCFFTGYLLRALLPVPALGLSQIGILFFLVAVAAGILLAWGDRRLGNFLKGAKGEEWVARELSFLDSGYTVFNGLRLVGSRQNPDHVVVGPSGVFVIETKSWRGSVEFRDGRLYADGKEPSRPPLKQVKTATAGLVEWLAECGCSDLPVHSVLCFLGTELPEEIMNVNGVVVCRGERLADVLCEKFGEPVAESLRNHVADVLKEVVE